MLRGPESPTLFTYLIDAGSLALRTGEGGQFAFLRDGQQVGFIPTPTAHDAESADSVAKTSLADLGGGRYRLEISLDKAFMDSAAYPVVLDPSWSPWPPEPFRDGWVNQNQPNTSYEGQTLIKVGQGRHTYIRFPNPIVSLGRLVYSATVTLGIESQSNGWDSVDAKQVTQDWPGNLTWNNRPAVNDYIHGMGSSPGGGSLQIQLKSLYQHYVDGSWWDRGFRLASPNSNKAFYAQEHVGWEPNVTVVYNDLPAAPSLGTPGSNAVYRTGSPTLSLAGPAADPNGDRVLYNYQVATSSSFSNIVWQSDWDNEETRATVPPGELAPGTYWWRVQARDVCQSPATLCSLTDGAGATRAVPTSAARTFTVALDHLGAGEETVWSQELGNGMSLGANGASGNLSLEVPLDTLVTPGGDLGLALSYDHQDADAFGLGGGWRLAAGPWSERLPVKLKMPSGTGLPAGEVVSVAFADGAEEWFTQRASEVYSEVRDGQQSADLTAGWQIAYGAAPGDPSQLQRVQTIVPPVPQGALWQFDYVGPFFGSVAAQTFVTDPRGVASPTPGDFQTRTDFSSFGLPVSVAGPADQHGIWPVTTQAWDTNSNLVCERSPESNSVEEGCTATVAPGDLDTKYGYEPQPPYALSQVTEPAPDPEGEGPERWKTTSTTRVSRACGPACTPMPTLQEHPRHRTCGPTSTRTGGRAAPQIGQPDEWAIRWTGLLDLPATNLYQFSVTTADSFVMSVGNSTVLDCAGGCTSAQRVFKGRMYPVTMVFEEQTGPASFTLKWRQGTGGWQTMQASQFEPSAGVITTATVADHIQSTGQYPDGESLAQQLPTTEVADDLEPGGDTRETESVYDDYGRPVTVTEHPGTALEAVTTNTHTDDAQAGTSCMTQTVDPTGAVTDYECDEAGRVTRTTVHIRAVASQPAQQRVTRTVYDEVGRVVKEIRPDGGWTETQYDLAGRPIQENQLIDDEPESPPEPPLFSDGFETGDLSRWTASSGVTVVDSDAFSGAYAARALSTGSPAWARANFSTSTEELILESRFKVVSQGTNSATLMAVRAPGGAPILNANRNSSGKLQLWNNVTSQNISSTTTVSPGEWHHLELHVAIAGTDSTVETWLDDTRIDALSSTMDLGTNPVDQILIGESQSGRTLELLFDEVEASTPSGGEPPPEPPLFSDGFETGDLSQWTASSGVTVVDSDAFSGAYAARALSTGSPAWARANFSTTTEELILESRFKVVSQGTNSATLMAVRAPGGAPILNANRNSSGKLQLWNNVTSQNISSTTTVSPGEWHHLELHVAIAGTDSTVETWLDGARIDALSSTMDLGTGPVDQILIGESQSGRTLELLFDEVEASTPSGGEPSGSGTEVIATTVSEYDTVGNLVREILPDPDAEGPLTAPQTIHAYDTVGNETSMTDPRGKTWLTQFDAANRVIAEITPTGLVTATNYEMSDSAPFLNKMTVTDPFGVHTITDYDVLNRPTSERVGTLQPTTYEYDEIGNVIRTTDPAGVWTEQDYDGFGQVTEERTPYGPLEAPEVAVTTYEYDAAGNLTETDGPRTDVNDSLAYEYDLVGRLTEAVQSGISVPNDTEFQYDDAGEMVKVTDPEDRIRHWTFDEAGREASYQDAAGTTTSYHNYGGWLIQQDDPRGLTLRYSYDRLGRQTRRWAEDSLGERDAESFAFDPAGNRTSATAESSGLVTTFTYDDDGRLTGVTQGSDQTTSTFNPSTGMLTSITDPGGGITTYGYDSGHGLLSTLSDSLTSQATTYVYDNGGRVTSRTDPTGLVWERTYDSAGYVSTQTVTRPGSTVASFSLGYDEGGNVVTKDQFVSTSTDNGQWSYEYDGANRLISAEKAGEDAVTYGYDGSGNRTSARVGTASAVTTTYDARGLPVSSSDGTAYQHDQVGNLTGTTGPGPDRAYGYDAWRRMTSADDGPTDIAYGLDALGRLVTRDAGSSISTYSYVGDTENIAAMVEEAAATRFAYSPSGPLAQETAAGVRFLIPDLHEDLVGLADMSGAVVGTTTYSPWGEPRTEFGEGSILGFQGDPTDPSIGLVDMVTRLYEPHLGRFVSRDVVFGDVHGPVSLNTYIYGWDNPISSVDPDGMKPAKRRRNRSRDAGPRSNPKPPLQVTLARQKPVERCSSVKGHDVGTTLIGHVATELWLRLRWCWKKGKVTEAKFSWDYDSHVGWHFDGLKLERNRGRVGGAFISRFIKGRFHFELPICSTCIDLSDTRWVRMRGNGNGTYECDTKSGRCSGGGGTGGGARHP